MARSLTRRDGLSSLYLYSYLALLAGAIVVANLLTLRDDAHHPDDVLTVLYLLLASALLNLPRVRLDRGYLSLTGVAIGAAAILMNPLDATLTGLGMALGHAGRGFRVVLSNAASYAAIAWVSALMASYFRFDNTIPLIPRLITLFTFDVANLSLIAVGLSFPSGESVLKVVRHNLTPSFGLALVYFNLASLLISYVLDGTLLGYLLATIVCILALALTDTIAGRRVRRVRKPVDVISNSSIRLKC